MDSIFRSLRVEMVGVQVKHASVITREEEILLWEQAVLILNTPLGLLSAVFYSNGKLFCLQGGNEHRNLKISQFVSLILIDTFIQKMDRRIEVVASLTSELRTRFPFMPTVRLVFDVM